LGKGFEPMIADVVARIEAIEQQLTGKTLAQLQARLTIRGALKELRGASHQTAADAGGETRLDQVLP
jgi:hypothetical protein